MKYIVAIIQPDKLEDVKEELFKREIFLMSVTEIIGCGRQKGATQVYRGHREVGCFRRKLKLEIAVNEDFVKPAVEAIIAGARTGNVGDGKIFVLDLEDVIRIGTGESGEVAIG